MRPASYSDICESLGEDPERERIVVVCGSRSWNDEAAIRARLAQLIPASPEVPWPTIVHGAAKGADEISGRVALELGFWVDARPADWARDGRGAGFKRNWEMLKLGPILVIAFQRDGSRGTQHTIDSARSIGIHVEVVEWTGPDPDGQFALVAAGSAGAA